MKPLLNILVASCLLLGGCSGFSEDQALNDFKAAYPNATVYQQFVGEGDSDHAYMHFRYTESGSEKTKEVMWQYQKQNNGSWIVINKSGPKEPGSDFGD